MNKGLLIVISAPSGGGKGTILKKVFAENPNLRYSVSATTRAPREGEEDGIHYFFITREQFCDLIHDGKMLEYAEYCGNFYGTPRDRVEEARSQGHDVILEIEVQGGAQIKKLVPDCVSVFITPPSVQVLEQRLRDRGTEDEGTIQKRLAAARQELPQASNYDYLIINHTVDAAAQELLTVIHAEKLKTKQNRETLERMLLSC